MVDEFFYGFTLKGENAEHKWTGHKVADDEDEHTGEISSKLILKRCLLGPEAGTEQNVVEVETMSMSDMVKVPVCVLKVGEERQVNLGELEFFDAPVTFRLTHGKGPVHVLGQHLQQDDEEQMVDMEEFGEDEDEDSENEIRADDNGDENPKKKMKLSKNHKKGKGDKK